MFHFYTLGNVRKSKVFWRFPGIWKWNIVLKWVSIRSKIWNRLFNFDTFQYSAKIAAEHSKTLRKREALEQNALKLPVSEIKFFLTISEIMFCANLMSLISLIISISQFHETSRIRLFNPFLVNVPILYPLKTPENLWFSGVFREYKIGTLARNRLRWWIYSGIYRTL